MEVSWAEFKTFAAARALSVQWVQVGNRYFLYAIDGALSLRCMVPLTDPAGDDQADFEANFKAAGNQSFSDIDGIPFFRLKASKKGWTYNAIPIEFQTSRLSDTLYSKDHTNASRSGITLKAYNASDQEVTVPGLLNANYATIVRTVIDIELPYDVEVIGGTLRALNDISQDLRCWVVAVPDIAAPTGSKEMVGGINLNYLAPNNAYEVDGRVTKLLTYDATYHTSKLRFIFRYNAGVNESLSVVLETYKQ